MLLKGTARLEASVLGYQFSYAPLRRCVQPPECSELWAGYLAPFVAWPSLASECFDPPRDWDSTCGRCGGLFSRSVGASGRFCSRLCYETPDRYAKQRRYRESRVATNRCPRCGRARDGYNCANCRAKMRPQQTERQRRRRGHQPWRPGSHGPTPLAIRAHIKAADAFRAAILSSPEAQGNQSLARAAIVLLCGFFLGQRLDWIVRWTGFRRSECIQIIGRLNRYRVWDGQTMACTWLDVFVNHRKIPKRERWKIELAFWLDAGVANGDFTRDGEPENFRYGLAEWESDASPATR